MLNLHKLEIFAQVVQAGSFSGAAKGLLMTQSAVSQHIRDLETTLGAILFERKARGVTLTPAGETLHEYVQRIFGLLAQAENAVTDVAKLAQGRLNIGATPGVSVYLLPSWLQEFREEYPNLIVTIHTATSPEILNKLQTGQADIGIIEGEISPIRAAEVEVQTLDEIEQQVVVGPQHPWWGREQITMQQLESQGCIMRQPASQTRIWLDEKLKHYHVQPLIKGEFDNIETIKRAVAIGTCLAILPPYAVEQEVAVGTLHEIAIEESPLVRTLKLVWNHDVPVSPIVRAFLTHLGKFAPLIL